MLVEQELSETLLIYNRSASTC